MIDESRMMYCRLPKEEQPRPPGQGDVAGPLEDAVWHDFVSWSIELCDRRRERDQPCLHVEYQPFRFLHAPQAQKESE